MLIGDARKNSVVVKIFDALKLYKLPVPFDTRYTRKQLGKMFPLYSNPVCVFAFQVWFP